MTCRSYNEEEQAYVRSYIKVNVIFTYVFAGEEHNIYHLSLISRRLTKGQQNYSKSA